MFGINKGMVQFGLHAKRNIIEFTQELKDKYDAYSSDAKIRMQANVYADLPTTFYDSPNNTKTVKLNDLAYVNNPSSGLFGLVNRKPAGLYKFDGTTWIISYDYTALISALSQKIDQTQVNNSIQTTWRYLCDTWSEIPTEISNLSNGIVMSYVLNSITRYRYIPTNYNPAEDAFYSNFDGTNLTNKIISRA